MEFFEMRYTLTNDGNKNGSSSDLCIAKDSQHLMRKYICNCSSAMPNKTCEEIPDDVKIRVVLWSITAFIFLLLFVQLVAIRISREHRGFVDNVLGKLVFAMGIFSSMVTQFCTMSYSQEKTDSITVWFNIVLGLLSIVFIIFGFKFIFNRSPNNNIGSHDRGMGLVIFIIASGLVGLEVFLIIVIFKGKNNSPVATWQFGIFFLGFMLEKIIQTFFYILIRRCKPNEEYKRGAVFYFNFLAFVNFTLWLNSIPFADIPIYNEVSHDKGLQYVDDTYRALIIDYRLLCALLFLEHSFAISEGAQGGHPGHEGYEMLERRHLYTFFGVAIGLVCFSFEVANVSQFWHKDIFGVNVCPILVDVLLVVLGIMLLKNVHGNIIESIFHNHNVTMVELMVMSMGAASIVYLLNFSLMSLTSFIDEKPVAYVKWSASVFLFRGSSLLLLLLVYTGIPVNTMETEVSHNSWCNYVLVSALSVGIFARFVGSILDEFHGKMHHIAHHRIQSKKLRSLQDLFQLGPLFQLATCLHLSLHFFLMLLRLYEKPKVENVQADVDEGFGAGDAVVPPGQPSEVAFGNPRQSQRIDDSAFESEEHPTAPNEGTPLLQ